MTDPILALRQAIRAALEVDDGLVAALGGARIYDETPRGASGLYVVFGDARVRDWSTGTDRGHEHDVALNVWSKAGGAKPALEAAALITACLDDAPLSLDGHRLVSIRVTGEDVRRDERANLARVIIRLRATTEII